MNYGRIDLHLHLDGSLYLPWAYEVSKREGVIDETVSYNDYYKMMYRTDYKTREEGFKKFEVTCDAMQTKEDLKMSIWHLIRILNFQGMYYAEIRFAPQQHCKKGLTQKEAVLAVIDGINQAKIDFPEVEVGLINCMMHKGANALVNEKENYETIEVTKELLGKGVVGLDLAGYENNGDYKLYAPLFKKAKEYNLPTTCHAAEMGDGSHILDALSFGVDRIGHGIDCVNDPSWLKAVVDSQIPLEVCVTSNQKDRLYANHPIKQLLEAGCKVTINTDNMMFSRTNVAFEHANLYSLGVDEETLYKCALNSVEAAFCSEEVKAKLRAKFEALHDSK